MQVSKGLEHEDMASSSKPGENYTIRRKVFKIAGAAFHIYGEDGSLVGYCAQKAFKLREDLRIYTDESKSQELMRIGTRQIVDFGATYEVTLPDGSPLGSYRRKGMKSLLRDTWMVFGPEGRQVGTVQEDSAGLAVTRRLLGDYGSLIPQTFHIDLDGGGRVASYRTHFNLFVHRIGVTIHEEDTVLDDLMLLAGGCLLAAIEGRQG